jgi:hypothetical protein
LETSSQVIPDVVPLSVYPSPARDEIFIQCHSEPVELISILQPDGKVIPIQTRLVPNEVFSQSILSCPPGILFLKYQFGREIFSIKFLKM